MVGLPGPRPPARERAPGSFDIVTTWLAGRVSAPRHSSRDPASPPLPLPAGALPPPDRDQGGPGVTVPLALYTIQTSPTPPGGGPGDFVPSCDLAPVPCKEHVYPPLEMRKMPSCVRLKALKIGE